MTYVFTSKRLSFSPITQKDIPAVFALHTFPEVGQYNTLGIPSRQVETERLLTAKLDAENKRDLGWVVYDFSKNFIGELGMIVAPERFQKAELSYSIHPEHWNRGYATEALQSLIQFGFNTLGLHRIEAGVAVDNKASIRVLEKAGFIREGVHRKILPLASGWSDNYSYAILKEDIFGRLKKRD